MTFAEMSLAWMRLLQVYAVFGANFEDVFDDFLCRFKDYRAGFVNFTAGFNDWTFRST
jgi:hypothetical protein